MTEQAASLYQSARRALAGGNLVASRDALAEALALDAGNIRGWLNLAAVSRQLDDVNAALRALREVLRLEPRNFVALLMMGSLQERLAQAKEAALSYGSALSVAPPEYYLDAPTQQALSHARDFYARHNLQLGSFVRTKIESATNRCSVAERQRIEAFVDTTLRTRKRYQQDPLEYYYPGLPAIEFYERGMFPWMGAFEASTTAMLEELQAVLRQDQAHLSPYIHYPDHVPLDQWRELNNSPRWSAFHFFERGIPVAARCERAPATFAAVSRLPQPTVAMRSPCALFSVLQPHTHIPPHTGVGNFRLVVHLPLILPSGCRFRVGHTTRPWRVGEAWVFDDTIEHEAWNDSDEPRTILICDIWSPYLSPDERAVIAQVIAATDAYSGMPPTSQI